MQRWIFAFSVIYAFGAWASTETKPAPAKDHAALFAQWAKITDPLPGPPATIGFYSSGCLAGSQKLPLDGPGYAVMRPSRNRYHGHPKLISYLTDLATKTQKQKLKFLLIGDLSPPRGGPMETGHASHQNGIDADIWLITLDKKPTTQDREKLSAFNFVTDRKKLKKSWGRTQEKILVAAADNKDVNRIFVSPPIKKHMCKKFPKASWLYRLRPWWGHEAHLHVRLNCPPDSPLCKSHDPLNPADNGCGTELTWWFSKEADEEWAKISSTKTPREFPELPSECASMLALPSQAKE